MAYTAPRKRHSRPAGRPEAAGSQLRKLPGSSPRAGSVAQGPRAQPPPAQRHPRAAAAAAAATYPGAARSSIQPSLTRTLHLPAQALSSACSGGSRTLSVRLVRAGPVRAAPPAPTGESWRRWYFARSAAFPEIRKSGGAFRRRSPRAEPKTGTASTATRKTKQVGGQEKRRRSSPEGPELATSSAR